MTTETKKKVMTPKWFLSLATRSGIKSAEAFLAAHRDWLENGELAKEVSPILVQIDSKEVFPSPGLNAIMHVALGHVMASTIAKAEEQLNQVSSPKTDKPYVGVIYNANGTVATVINDKKEERELRAGFNHPQEADRWCQRRLSEGSAGQFGLVTWTKVLTKAGTPMTTRHDRDDAIRALIPKKRTPYMHQNRSNGQLKNRMSVGQTHVRFSQG